MSSSHKGTLRGYAVEARSIAAQPEEIRGVILDERWRTFPWKLHAEGRQDKILEMVDLVDYATAQSFRWRLHSDFFSAVCLETRLVEYEVMFSFETKRIAEHEILGMRDTMHPPKNTEAYGPRYKAPLEKP